MEHASPEGATQEGSRPFGASLSIGSRSPGLTPWDIDARPSDSIALALKTGAPIFVADKVMNHAALHPDQMPESELDQLALLNQKLQEAVADEAYEEAARIRDQIRELEEKMGGGKAGK